MTTPLWFDKVSILYEKKYLFEIIPNKHFDFNRKLNSLLRLSIYYALINYLLDQKKKNMFYIPFVVAIITYILNNRYVETFTTKIETDLTYLENGNTGGWSSDLEEHLKTHIKTTAL